MPDDEIEKIDGAEELAEAWRSFVLGALSAPEAVVQQYMKLRRTAGLGRFRFWVNWFILSGARGGQGLPVTQVATRKQWLKLGRDLRPGARTIPIFGVIGRSGRGFSDGGPVRWKVNREYDVQDTEGQPLPKLPPASDVQVDPEHAERFVEALTAALPSLIPNRTIEILRTPPPKSGLDGSGTLGATNGKWIFVRPELLPFQYARVFAHEVAHNVLGHVGQAPGVLADWDSLRPDSRADQEVEADLTALIVCASWGMDVTEHTRAYLAHWQRAGLRPEVIADHVLDAVRRIFYAMPPPELGRRPPEPWPAPRCIAAIDEALGRSAAPRAEVQARALRRLLAGDRISRAMRARAAWQLQETLLSWDSVRWHLQGEIVVPAQPEEVPQDSPRPPRPYPDNAPRRWPSGRDERVQLEPLDGEAEFFGLGGHPGGSVTGRFCYRISWRGPNETRGWWRVIAMDDGSCFVDSFSADRYGSKRRQRPIAPVASRFPSRLVGAGRAELERFFEAWQ
jgi:hypothetical protein